MIGGRQVFAAILDPFDRAPDPPAGDGHQIVFGIQLAPGAEATADIGLDQLDRGLWQIECCGKVTAVKEIDLGCAVQAQQRRVGIEFRDQPARFHRYRAVPVGREPFAAGISGAPERVVGIAAPNGIAGRHIFAGVFVNKRVARRRLIDLRDRRQGGKIDLDQVQRVFGDIAVRGDHNGNRLADITHFVIRDRSLKKTLKPVERREPQRDFREIHVDIRCTECIDHAGYRLGRRQIDGVDPRMGMGAAIDRHHRHVR